MSRTNPNDSISMTQPIVHQNGETIFGDSGLTKREYFAAMAMQGLLANPDTGMDIDEIMNDTVKCADFLIDILNKESKG